MNNLTIDPATLHSIAESAKVLPYSEPGIRARTARGELRVVRIAGRIYIEGSELRRVFGDRYQPRSK